MTQSHKPGKPDSVQVRFGSKLIEPVKFRPDSAGLDFFVCFFEKATKFTDIV